MGHTQEIQLFLQAQTSKLFTLYLSRTTEVLIETPSFGKQKFILCLDLMGLIRIGA